MAQAAPDKSAPSAWPALDHEERDWVSRFNADELTRTQRERIRLPYSAAVTPRIAELQIDIPWRPRCGRRRRNATAHSIRRRGRTCRPSLSLDPASD